MNAEQIRTAMAEVDGYLEDRIAGLWLRRGVEYKDEEVPNYPSDLNAVHEVEQKLKDGQFAVFENHLAVIVLARCTNPRPVSATALQRCEAILRTLGKWEA